MPMDINNYKKLFFNKMTRWLVYSIIIGIASALVAAAFFFCLQYAKHITFHGFAGYNPPSTAGEKLFEAETSIPFRQWIFFLLPVIGGLLSGIIVYFFAPEAEGHGTDAMIDAFHNKQGIIRQRVPLVKAVATIITLSTGGSAGREGPIAQIGAGLGSTFAKIFKLSTKERRIFLLAGCGAGLSAIFRAPLGGALTAIEVLYREDLETEAFIPTVISSITSYIVFTSIYGDQPIFYFPSVAGLNPGELLIYLLLGLICIPLGIFYIKFFYGMRDRVFHRINIPKYLKPMIGGFFVGLIGIFIPQIYGDGWGWIQMAILGKLGIGLMLLIAIFKIFATSFTISSGGSGGIFGPTLFIGGMIGGAVGYSANYFYPEIAVHPGAYVVVGMASFFAGVANAPLGSLLMCSEMTKGYDLIAPLMLVSIIAILFTKKYSIYEKQVNNRMESPAHVADFTTNILEDIMVKDIFKPGSITGIKKNMSYGMLKNVFAGTEKEIFPVYDDAGKLTGTINWDTARPIIFEQGLEDLVVAEDLMTAAETVSLDDSAYSALVKFLESNQDEILVVDPENPDLVIGILEHSDLTNAYNREIIKRKSEK